MTLRLFLIRHGETEWSLTGKHSGRVDLPLTEHGEKQARELGDRIRLYLFAHVFTSPLRRARRTCELVGLSRSSTVEPDLIEWDNGDYEGQTTSEVVAMRPDWNLFRDGCPNGEMPETISARADRLIQKLVKLDGNVALFSHSHFGRVLAARWIGLAAEHAQPLLLKTASLSILCYEHDQPAIALWNSAPLERFANRTDCFDRSTAPSSENAIQRWENEGGEIPLFVPEPGEVVS
jgi:probable phosphoglycerate mutase